MTECHSAPAVEGRDPDHMSCGRAAREPEVGGVAAVPVVGRDEEESAVDGREAGFDGHFLRSRRNAFATSAGGGSASVGSLR